MTTLHRNPRWLLALLGLAAACGGEGAAPEPPLRPIVYEPVGSAGGDSERTFSGTAVSGRSVALSFRSSGVVAEVDMEVGQRVRAGQLLARLDNVAARLAYEQAILGLNGAASQMNTAQLALDRTRALYESGTASLSDYESARNAFRTAEASHESAVRSVQIQEEQVQYGFIYAPVEGTIALVNVDVDENVQAGQLVAVLNAGSDLEIAVGLPEAVIARAARGMPATVTFSAVPGRSFAGRVTEVSPSVDAATATYPVRVAFEDESEAVRAGMAASVTFAFGRDTREGTLFVPARAVGEDGNGRFVFVVEGGGAAVGTVRKQRVEVGELTPDGFEILSGLTAGDNVATAGLQTLLDGQRVRLRQGS